MKAKMSGVSKLEYSHADKVVFVVTSRAEQASGIGAICTDRIKKSLGSIGIPWQAVPSTRALGHCAGAVPLTTPHADQATYR